ncbi:MAG: cyclodeaminase/cyclohydrolase family protein [Elusimicrobiaceae bacterium]|nr:cyclodeaminase/cyclohydrolase family protein [Elusimicrobiaceae bacterium]
MVTWQEGANCFIDALADKNSVPGGGSAAALNAAMGAALILMSAGVTIKRKATPQADKDFLAPYLKTVENYKNELKKLTAEDAAAYLEVISLKKQANIDEKRLAKAQIKAAEIPGMTAQKAQELLKIIDIVESKIAKIIASDILCAKALLVASLKCCAENIKTNLPYIVDENLKNKLSKVYNEITDLCRSK